MKFASGALLRQYFRRQPRGMMTTVARRLDVSISTVSNWTAGKRRIPIQFCPVLAALIGIRSYDRLRPDLTQSLRRVRRLTHMHRGGKQ